MGTVCKMGTMTLLALLGRLDELPRAERGLGWHGQLLLRGHLRATVLVPNLLRVSSSLPSPQVTAPALRPYSHLPIGLSLALKGISVPSTTC